jgi:hypothetical protein
MYRSGKAVERSGREDGEIQEGRIERGKQGRVERIQEMRPERIGKGGCREGEGKVERSVHVLVVFSCCG